MNNESMRKLWLEEMCEKKEDSERYAIYENDAELVFDWWIKQITHAVEQREKEIVNLYEKLLEQHTKFGLIDRQGFLMNFASHLISQIKGDDYVTNSLKIITTITTKDI